MHCERRGAASGAALLQCQCQWSPLRSFCIYASPTLDSPILAVAATLVPAGLVPALVPAWLLAAARPLVPLAGWACVTATVPVAA
eukprot:364798-Chlamydomonas_euryale.AAC.21